jgi:hypothetical protein
MNERIKQLAEQAMVSISYRVCQNTFKEIEDPAGHFVRKEFSKEKFAELIVRECIRVSEAHANDLESKPTDPLLEMYDNGIVNGIYEATEAIKEHFGVENA